MATLALHDALTTSVQLTTSEDDYPVAGIYTFEHDNIAINFDCYWDGSNTRSSDSGSNAQIVKFSDRLKIVRRNGRNQGDTVNGLAALAIHLNDGTFRLPYVYGIQLSGGKNPEPLYAQDDGALGLLTSSRRYKENIRTLNPTDVNWVFDLRPVKYDYKGATRGKNQLGLIAEEVEEVAPSLVSYKSEIRYGTYSVGHPVSESAPVIETTDIPETVNYSKLIVPLLLEMQELKRDLASLVEETSKLKRDYPELLSN